MDRPETRALNPTDAQRPLAGRDMVYYVMNYIPEACGCEHYITACVYYREAACLYRFFSLKIHTKRCGVAGARKAAGHFSLQRLRWNALQYPASACSASPAFGVWLEHLVKLTLATPPLLPAGAPVMVKQELPCSAHLERLTWSGLRQAHCAGRISKSGIPGAIWQRIKPSLEADAGVCQPRS
ncbi:hypothetical protein F66182_10188 [Fusarium sp. NRRL 66182]|nr:hypothetical protein F66182_10188 [Fusarium sp. NRRL 66182]